GRGCVGHVLVPSGAGATARAVGLGPPDACLRASRRRLGRYRQSNSGPSVWGDRLGQRDPDAYMGAM
ncbi:MAG: hypothetical protein AVDCRST_MAG14-2471, partial [uncultured Rubrobacteraceae bacterium]